MGLMSILVVLFFFRCRLVVCCGNGESISLIIIFFWQAKNLGLLFGYWTTNSSFKLMKKRLFSMNLSFCWFFSFRFWFSLQFIFPFLFSSSHTLVRQFWLWIDITWLNFFFASTVSFAVAVYLFHFFSHFLVQTSSILFFENFDLFISCFIDYWPFLSSISIGTIHSRAYQLIPTSTWNHLSPKSTLAFAKLLCWSIGLVDIV